MTVYRPAKSRFYHFDFQFRGERFHGSTSCTSKTAAKEFEADRRREVGSGKKEKPAITVDEACGLYWADKGQHESNSATTKGQIKRLVRMIGGAKLLGDLELTDLDRFVARRRGQTAHRRKTLVTNATVNREIELARRVWRHAESRQFAVAKIEWGELLLKEPAERVREMLAEEEKRFWAKAPSPDLAAVAEFALISGQRRTSVITLLRSKVDLAGMRAEVRIKGGAWHSFPLTPRLVAIIANQPKAGPYVFTYVCERPSPPRKDRVRRLKGHRYPFSKQGWMRKWRQWLKDAEIEDFRFHDLRHTAGTRLLRSSGNLKAVQKLLGHVDIATTSRYAHALEDDVRQAMIGAESRNSPEPVPGVIVEIGRNSMGRG